MKRIWIAVAGLSGCLMGAADVMACAVCMGDRDSNMVKGAESGVLLMVLVTYALLIGVGGIVTVWAVRARRLRIAQGDAPISGGGSAPP
jgi:uncharacterized membrane protein YhaH (DUF805 family)